MTNQIVNNKKKKYFIVAPIPSGSAGVRCLYNLREELEQRGYESKIIVMTNKVLNGDIYCQRLTKENLENDIVIYPEIIEGNPLLFRHVVRWLLNDPLFWGISGKYHNGEKLFAFDKKYNPNIPCLKFDTIDRNLFHDAHIQKDVNCFWISKRGLVRKIEDVPELSGAIQITKEWPKTRDELAKLLQRTDTLYSMDDNSSLLLEAKLCGAKVKIIEKDCIRDIAIIDNFNQELFEKQMNYFIEATQNFQYEGPINKEGYVSIQKRRKLKLEIIRDQLLYTFTHNIKVKTRLKSSKTKYKSCVWESRYVD